MTSWQCSIISRCTPPRRVKFGRFDGEDVYTTAESERLVRLPMYYGLTDADREKVIAKVLEFYAQ